MDDPNVKSQFYIKRSGRCAERPTSHCRAGTCSSTGRNAKEPAFVRVMTLRRDGYRGYSNTVGTCSAFADRGRILLPFRRSAISRWAITAKTVPGQPQRSGCGARRERGRARAVGLLAVHAALGSDPLTTGRRARGPIHSARWTRARIVCGCWRRVRWRVTRSSCGRTRSSRVCATGCAASGATRKSGCCPPALRWHIPRSGSGVTRTRPGSSPTPRLPLSHGPAGSRRPGVKRSRQAGCPPSRARRQFSTASSRRSHFPRGAALFWSTGAGYQSALSGALCRRLGRLGGFAGHLGLVISAAAAVCKPVLFGGLPGLNGLPRRGGFAARGVKWSIR